MNIKINDDKEQEKRIKQEQQMNSDIQDSASAQPVNPGRTPANLTGAGSSDTGGIDTSSSVGLDTNLTGVSPDDQSATLNTNGSGGGNRVGVADNQQLSNNTSNPTANNPIKTGIEQAEGGGFGNSAPDMGNTNQ